MSYIGNPIVSTDFPVDTFSGNGSTTAFTLTQAPASVNAIIVAVSGVLQEPSTYTISGTTLTFTAAPPSGTSNISVRHLGVAGIPNTPVAGSVQYSSLNSSLQGTLVGRNRIINGAMMIDQRNAGASVTQGTSFSYPVDRFGIVGSVTSKFTAQQNAGSVTPPAGFINYLGCTSSSAYSVPSGELYIIRQGIEGFNIADLAWGTANAKTVTLSFWVRSSLTGTFGGSLRNNAADRSYPYSYTISSANTWEYKTVTIAGDTTGTWLTNNSAGIFLFFSLGTGSTFSNTAGAWAAGDFRSATGATSVVGTNGATFYITGVQLEVGSTATSFDYRPYGTELQLCQRYCVVFTGLGGGARFGSGYYNSSTTAFNTNVPIATPLRASPTVTASDMTIGIQGAAPTISSISGISYNANIPNVNFISNTSTGTDGAFGQMRVNATTSSLTISAEL